MQTTIQEGNERLLKLAQHLETGKLGHTIFDFSVVNANLNKKPLLDGCGTRGCALGEMPFVYPGTWRFSSTGVVAFREDYGNLDCWEGAEWFFAISDKEADHLFAPLAQNIPGSLLLMKDATKEEVAENIRAFVALPHRQTN